MHDCGTRSLPLQVDLPERDLGGPVLQLLLHVGGGLEEERQSDCGGLGRHQQARRPRRGIGIINNGWCILTSRNAHKYTSVNSAGKGGDSEARLLAPVQ